MTTYKEKYLKYRRLYEKMSRNLIVSTDHLEQLSELVSNLQDLLAEKRQEDDILKSALASLIATTSTLCTMTGSKSSPSPELLESSTEKIIKSVVDHLASVMSALGEASAAGSQFTEMLLKKQSRNRLRKNPPESHSARVPSRPSTPGSRMRSPETSPPPAHPFSLSMGFRSRSNTSTSRGSAQDDNARGRGNLSHV